MINKKISHYKIIDKIGEGGMGIVYKAEDIRLKRIDALKFLPASKLKDPEAKLRFEREAQAAAALNHPNIVTIYEIDEFENQIYIAMEYVDGYSLEEIIPKNEGEIKSNKISYKLKNDNHISFKTDIMENKKSNLHFLPELKIIDIALQICEGLKKAHIADIIHRDIKPQNILLNRDGRIKILDFGLAKLKGVSKLTLEDSAVGTINYMSPEQAQGKDVDSRTDIWSLGVILYEIITGLVPFRGDYPQAAIYSILNCDPEPIEAVNPNISPDMQKIVYKTLEKDPNKRYLSIDELIRDLRKLISDTGIEKLDKLSGSEEVRLNSIAVFDFENMNKDTTFDWLSGGIAETVTVDLKKISALKVMSREVLSNIKSEFFKEEISEKQIIEIGKKMEIRWFIWGGYQIFGNSIRITSHILEISSGEMIGSSKVDGTIADIFKLQDRIITDLMETINLEISNSELSKIAKPETEDLEAYECFAKGRYCVYQMGLEDLKQAIGYFKKAIELDPHYALAYSGLGSVYMLFYIAKTDIKDLEQGIDYLQKAIKYDSDLCDPYLWLTYGYTRKGRFDDAIKSGERALKIESDNWLASYFLGTAYFVQGAKEFKCGLFKYGVKYLKKTMRLQPRSIFAYMNIAWIYMFHGEYQQVEVYLSKAIEIEESGKFEGPKFIGSQALMGNLLLKQNKLDEALEMYRHSITKLKVSKHVYSKQFHALSLIGIGNICFIKRIYDDALVNYKRALSIINSSKNSLGMGYLYCYAKIGMAKAFYTLDMEIESKKYIMEIQDLIVNKDIFDFNWIWEGSDGQVYFEIASFYSLKYDLEKTLIYLQNAIDCCWSEWPRLEIDESFDTLKEDKSIKSKIPKLQNRL